MKCHEVSSVDCQSACILIHNLKLLSLNKNVKNINISNVLNLLYFLLIIANYELYLQNDMSHIMS